jgi:Icc-related predicted phosphoesterase
MNLEFGDIELTNSQAADVLILAGDICMAVDANKDTEQGRRVQDFFRRCNAQFDRVIYIMGNHEHYQGDYAKSAERLRYMLTEHRCSNVVLLDQESVTVDDVTFVGGTLWTDFNRQDSLTMWHAGKCMNDYQVAVNSGRTYNGYKPYRLLPEDVLSEHEHMLSYISTVTAEQHDRKFVVVGHHAPSSQSVAEQYKGDSLMNGNFFSDLEQFILDRPQIKLWIHGHMHNNSNYWIGETQVICNPRGYVGHEESANWFQLQHVEV